MEATALFFMPRSYHVQLIDDMRYEYVSKWQCSYDTARAIGRAIPGNVRLAFRSVLVFSEIAALCVAFSGAHLTLGLIVGLAIAFFTLRLRDGHIYKRGEPGDASLDVLFAMGFGVPSMLVAELLLSEASVPLFVLMRGIAFALPALMLLRTIFRPEGPRPLADQAYHDTAAMSILYLTAWAAFAYANNGSGMHRLDQGFITAQLLIIVFAFRRGQQEMSRISKTASPTTWKTDPVRVDLARKLGNLWTPKGYGAEILFFSVSAIQLGVAIAYSPSWLQVATNILGFTGLLLLWIPIRAAHQATAIQLKEAIQLRDAMK